MEVMSGLTLHTHTHHRHPKHCVYLPRLSVRVNYHPKKTSQSHGTLGSPHPIPEVSPPTHQKTGGESASVHRHWKLRFQSEFECHGVNILLRTCFREPCNRQNGLSVLLEFQTDFRLFCTLFRFCLLLHSEANKADFGFPVGTQQLNT